MESFFEGWVSRYEQLLSELQSAPRDCPDLARDLVTRTLAHYHEYYHERSRLAARDVLAVFSPTWLTSYERTFLWIAGWKPSLAFRLLSAAVPTLSAEQGSLVADLRRATAAAERGLSEEMAQVQEAVASTQVLRAVRAARNGEGRLDAADAIVGRLGMLLGCADALVGPRSHAEETQPTYLVICCGQSEAFAATILATIDQGDEVLLFDPAYETYDTCIALAGGIPVYVALDPPYWTLDLGKFMKSFTNRTKAVVLNSPHNPTGKVFTHAELQAIAEICCKMNCFAITDEVYEHIVFDMQKHTSLASLPGMEGRTIITSSLSKTYSITGWRIGWACAPANIASAIRNIHIRIVDSAPAPFQEAALTALRSPPAYFISLRTSYEAKRDYVVKMLSELGFQIHFKPQGSVFVFAELPESWLLSDVDFARELIEKARVAVVPGCGFFHTYSNDRNYRNRYVRLAFCKSDTTLTDAVRNMRELVNDKGYLQL